MESLFESCDCGLWRSALACYEEVVGVVAAQKKKTGAKRKMKAKEEDLPHLDAWFQRTLPEVVAARSKPHLTHEELKKLMQWKLTRGKFRPRLTELIQQNSPEEVERITQSAFTSLPDLEKAVKLLSASLKGVGPATASAILCALSPTRDVPFMADESVMAVPDMKLEYNLKHYLAYAKKVQSKAKQLNDLEKPSSGKSWTPHDVELALWSFHFANRLKPELLRKDAITTTEDSNEEEPPTKRHKH